MNLVIVLLFATTLLGNSKIPIEQSIKNLKLKRVNVIENIVKNPFLPKKRISIQPPTVIKKVEDVKPIEQFNLQWIYNQSVLIDNKWYEKGDMIFEKKIISIDEKGVVLQQGERKLKVTIDSNSRYRGIEIGKLK